MKSNYALYIFTRYVFQIWKHHYHRRMHKPLVFHRSYYLPLVTHHVIPLHKPKRLRIKVPTQHIYISTVRRTHRRHRTTRILHRLHIHPLICLFIVSTNSHTSRMSSSNAPRHIHPSHISHLEVPPHTATSLPYSLQQSVPIS